MNEKVNIEREELNLILSVLANLEEQSSDMAKELGRKVEIFKVRLDENNLPSKTNRAIIGARSILDKYGVITYWGFGDEEPIREPKKDSKYIKP